MTVLTREQLVVAESIESPGTYADLIDTGLALHNLRDAVLALHRPDPRHGGRVCEQDDQPYPCATARTVESVGAR
jgi:hypothetical protein